MPADPVRDSAVNALLRILDHHSHADVAIDRVLRRGKLSPRGGRFLTHLVYGVLRHKLLCDFVLSDLCDQSLDALPPPILMTLRMAIYQALFSDTVTRPAMVHTSVELAKKRGHAGLARVVNAVLRRAPSSLDEISFPDRTSDLTEYLRLRYSMPRWMTRLWIDRFGEEGAEQFCAASCDSAPTTIRANTRKCDVDTLMHTMTAAGFTVSRPWDALEALVVSGGGNLVQSKAFKRGWFMLQDPASMLVAHLAAPRAGERILDMCAAPGGKSTHMAALADGAVVVAAQDRYFNRAMGINENRFRLDTPEVWPVCGDGFAPPFRDGLFDRVLLDAPCSGLGTLRRHPEIKWRTTPDTPGQLAQTQGALLRKALQLCKNGGLVVYSVCTLTRQETLDVTSEVIAEGTCIPEDGPEQYNTWRTATGEYQTSPTDAAWDGFYLMRFRKRY